MQAEWARFNEWVSLDRRGNWLDKQATVNSRQAGGWDAAEPAMPLGVIGARPAPANPGRARHLRICNSFTGKVLQNN